MKSLLLAACLLATALAGCADDPANADDPDQPGVGATDTTGGIRGVVVDQSIVPLSGATVKVLDTQLTTTTDENGLFVFSGMDPGTYTVQASHPLYDTRQTSALVQAGVEEPPSLRLQLTRVILEEPTFQTLTFQGHIVCSTNLEGVGYSEECGEGVGSPENTCSTIEVLFGDCLGLPSVDNPIMPGERIGRNDKSHPQIWFRTPMDNPASFVVEQHWTPSLSLATGNTEDFYTRLAIDWICDPFCHGDSLRATTAPSPLHLYVGPEQIGERNITTETDLSTFTYSGASNGVILEQDFEEFITISWGLPLPEDWSFVTGSPDPW